MRQGKDSRVPLNCCATTVNTGDVLKDELNSPLLALLGGEAIWQAFCRDDLGEDSCESNI